MKKILLFAVPVMLLVFVAGYGNAQVAHSLEADPDAQAFQGIQGTEGSSRDATVGYCYRFTDDYFLTFPVPAFTPVSNLGLSGGDFSFYAGDFGPGGVYYVVDDAFKNLYSVNTTNGSVTLVAPVTGVAAGHTSTGMAYHDMTQTMYLSSTNITTSLLYSMNLTTGALTLIGEITNAPAIIWLAINCEGDMYGVDLINDNFLQINTGTGAGTIIGPVGVDVNFAQGADFDNSTGKLYWAAYPDGNLREINLATGSSSIVTGFGMEVDAFVINWQCGMEVPIAWWSILLGVLLIAVAIYLRTAKVI